VDISLRQSIFKRLKLLFKTKLKGAYVVRDVLKICSFFKKCSYQYPLSIWKVVNWFDGLIQGNITFHITKHKSSELTIQAVFLGDALIPQNTDYWQWDTVFPLSK